MVAPAARGRAARAALLADTRTNGHSDEDDEETPAAPLIPSGGRGFKKLSRQGIPVMLPGSGAVAVLKRVSLMAMSLKAGHVPNPLTAEVLRWIATNDDILAKLTPDQEIDNYRENSGVFAQIASLCFVHPRMILDRAVDDDNDDEIGPNDIADRDYTFIVFKWVEGNAAELAPFLVAARP